MWFLAFVPLLLPNVSGVQLMSDNESRVDVNFVSEMLDKLKTFVTKQTSSSEVFFDKEQVRLNDAISFVKAKGADPSALEATLKKTQLEKAEAQAASLEAMQYYHTVRAALGSKGGAPSCDFLTCGRNAVCRVKDNGRAFCECITCFAGDGYVCRPSSCVADNFYTVQPLQPQVGLTQEETAEVDAQDLSLTVLSKTHVLVAIRDAKQNNRGFLSVGEIGEEEVTWSKWQPFSGSSPAYDPVVAGISANGRFLVSYRDAKTRGVGYLIAGQLDLRDHDHKNSKVVLGISHGISREQDEKMALVALSGSRVVCLYADHVTDEEGNAKQVGAVATVVKVLAEGAMSSLGKYRFAAHVPVQYLTATPLSPTSFVVGYRALPANELHATSSHELSVVWMDATADDLLAIDPNPLALEEHRIDILQRDLALVSKDLFAYSYYCKSQKAVKIALVRVGEKHRLEVVGKPKVLSDGVTSYVGAISIAPGQLMPGTFTFFQPPTGQGFAQVCGVSAVGETTGCRHIKWADQEVTNAKGIRLLDTRLLLAFTGKDGRLSYRFISSEEAAGQEPTVV
jgi:hypothetical protein